MPRTLSHRDEDAPIVEHRRRNDRAARQDSGPRKPTGVFRIAVEPPDFVACRRVVGSQPPVSSAEEDLYASIDIGRHGAGPLAVQHLRARPHGAPDHFARTLVHRDQTWGARRWDARVAFVLSVGGRDHQQIADGQHFAIGGFVRKDTQAATHVQFPDDVGRGVVMEDLVPIGTVVLAITETLCVEATELAVGGDVGQPVPFHIRRTRRRRQQELSQPSLYAWGHVLPEECAILRVKRHEHAGFFLDGGIQLPCVVGAHIHHIADNDGASERFVSQRDAPDDVPAGRGIPVDRRIARLDDWRLQLGSFVSMRANAAEGGGAEDAEMRQARARRVRRRRQALRI